jgi:multiple sugar transport system substrate-binding protein
LAALTTGGAALAACQSFQTNPTPRSGEKVQLVFQGSREEWFQPMVQEMLARFHELHPNIQVFYTPEPEGPLNIQNKTLEDMQAGTAPDVFSGCCNWFPIWAQAGYTLDLRPFVEAELGQEVIAEWDAAHYRALFSRDGHQFGLPNYHGGLALYYNKDLFDRYQVSYPDGSWDHDDYLEAMKRLARDPEGEARPGLWGSQTYINWDRIQIHVNGWGGHLVDPDDPKKIRIADPPALAAQEWLRARIWDDRVMANALEVKKMWPDDVFLSGQIAMLEDGSWRLRHILSNADFRVGIAPFPAGPVRRVTLGTSDGYGIYAGTKHPEAAWELLKFLISQDFGRALARAGFLQPARASLLPDWIDFILAEFQEKTDRADLMAFADGHLKGYSVVGEVAAEMAETTRLASAAWDQILTLGLAPVDVLKDAARQMEAAQRQEE